MRACDLFPLHSRCCTCVCSSVYLINQYLELRQLLRGVVAVFCSKYQSCSTVTEKWLLFGTKQLLWIKLRRLLIYDHLHISCFSLSGIIQNLLLQERKSFNGKNKTNPKKNQTLCALSCFIKTVCFSVTARSRSGNFWANVVVVLDWVCFLFSQGWRVGGHLHLSWCFMCHCILSDWDSVLSCTEAEKMP